MSDAQTPSLQDKPRRLDGYYIGFDATGNPAVDKVLGAVACAGKARHHTDGWHDDATAYDDHTGRTPNDWIQNAANEAATALDRLEAALLWIATNPQAHPENINHVARAALEAQS